MREQQLTIYSQLRLINDSINTLRVKIEGEAMNHRCFQILDKRMPMLAFMQG